MEEKTLSLDHPILFVEDFTNSEVTIPEYSEASVVSSTSSCISIRALVYLDGEVTVKLIAGEPHTSARGLIEVFEGVIATPGRRVAVVSSENEKLLEADVPDERTRIKVSVNDKEFPSEIVVEAFGRQATSPGSPL